MGADYTVKLERHSNARARHLFAHEPITMTSIHTRGSSNYVSLCPRRSTINQAPEPASRPRLQPPSQPQPESEPQPQPQVVAACSQPSTATSLPFTPDNGRGVRRNSSYAADSTRRPYKPAGHHQPATACELARQLATADQRECGTSISHCLLLIFFSNWQMRLDTQERLRNSSPTTWPLGSISSSLCPGQPTPMPTRRRCMGRRHITRRFN
jgi:hypothetical protein